MWATSTALRRSCSTTGNQRRARRLDERDVAGRPADRLEEFVASIDATGYQGTYDVELFTMGATTHETRRLLERSAAGLAEILHGVSSMNTLRVGVVGCGRIAQAMHLPFLHELSEFELVALCDLSPAVLAAVGERYPTTTTHPEYEALVGRDDVDVVA